MSKVLDQQYCRVEVIAQLFGVTVRRVQQLTQEGVIQTVKTTENGRAVRRYDLGPTVLAYVKYLSDKAYGKKQKADELELKTQKLQAEIALKESQGELHRLRTDIAAGRYISIETARIDYERFFVEFKKFALSLPGKLGSHISGAVSPAELRRIEKEIRGDVIDQLRAFTMAGVVEAGEAAEIETKTKDPKI